MLRPALLLPFLLLVAACAGSDDPVPASGHAPDREARLRLLLGAVAHDSTRGRATGSPENREVAEFLAGELAASGVEPGWEGGFLQPVPLVRTGETGRLAIPSSALSLDTVAPARRVEGEVNVVGIVPGSDPALRDEVVVLGAHFDHVGVGPAVEGDSIYNGADDDGTGTVAVLEIARALAADPAPRTVVVLLSTAEEQGLLGTRWYLENPALPLDRTVADFQIEMIGRPDSLAGGPGHGWLTGYHRTTAGARLSEAGSPIVPDPRPEMRFFFRSDNLPFAQEGIPAHTLSSYGLHADYHQPSDEVERIDFAHFAALVDAAEEAVRLLAGGPEPTWTEGGRDGLDPPPEG